MSLDLLNSVSKLNNSELIALLKENGYGEFEEILEEYEVTGEGILRVTELEISNWSITRASKKRLWACLTKLRTQPELFYHQNGKSATTNGVQRTENFNKPNVPDKKPMQRKDSFQKPSVPDKKPLQRKLSLQKPNLPDKKVVMMQKQDSFQNRNALQRNESIQHQRQQDNNISNIRAKLEMVFDAKNAQNRNLLSNKRAPPVQENSESPEADYLNMQKPQSESGPFEHYDESGYLKPMPSAKDPAELIEENEYNEPAADDVANRKPMVLPRDISQQNFNLPQRQPSIRKLHIAMPGPAMKKEAEMSAAMQNQGFTDEPVQYDEPTSSEVARPLVLPASLPQHKLNGQTQPVNRAKQTDVSAGVAKRTASFLRKNSDADSSDQPPKLPTRNTIIRTPEPPRTIPTVIYENADVEKQMKGSSLDNGFAKRLKELFKKDPRLQAQLHQEITSTWPRSAKNNASQNEDKEKVQGRGENFKGSSGSLNAMPMCTGITCRPLPEIPSEKVNNSTPNRRSLNVQEDKMSTAHSTESLYENTAGTPEKEQFQSNDFQSRSMKHSPEPEAELPFYGNLPEPKPLAKLPRNLKAALDDRFLPQPPKVEMPPILFEPEAELEHHDQLTANLNDEPFYRNTDRKGARQLLNHLEDGAFLFRPSKKFFLTLTVKYKSKFFNVGIEKGQNNGIRCHTARGSMSPEFATIQAFINHFTTEGLTCEHENKIVEITLKRALPSNAY